MATAPLQTTYPRRMPIGQPGMPASMTGWNVDTRLCEDASGNGIGFGLAVCQGAGDRGARLGAPSGRNFVGITRATPHQMPSATAATLAGAAADHYRDGDNMPVCNMGDIWITSTGAAVAGDAVYFNAVTGTIGVSGGQLIEGARYMTTVAAGGLAIIRLSASVGNML